MGYAYALIYGAATIAGVSLLSAVVRAYLARVAADGGTSVDDAHAEEVYTDTVTYNPLLIESCESGKATVLYTLFAFQDINTLQARVTADSGTNADVGQNAKVAQHLWRNDLHESASIVVTCASIKAGKLYGYQPTVEPDTTLLDYYTGSAAAYSLRSLSTSTTNVVKVRRSGDDAELDFTADEVSDGTLAAWVVAGGGTEDGFVTTWYDQSGNANNATQATAANQPKIVDSGSVITQGSKPIIKFVDNDFLLSAAFSVSVNRTYVMTLYSATNTNTSFKGYLTFNNGYLDNFINGLVGAANTSNVVTSWVADGSANTRVGTTALTDGNYYLLSVLVEGGVQHQHYRNGVLNAENTSLSISPETASRVLDILKTGTTGNDLRTNEAIIWDSYQSANRTGIEGNINDHYGIY